MEDRTERQDDDSSEQEGDQPSEEKEQRAHAPGTPATGGAGFNRLWWLIIGPALAAAILVPLGRPMLNAVGDGLDGIRDSFRSPGGQDADTLKEDLQERDYWEGDPTLLDGSFRFLRHHADDPWSTVDGARARYLTVEELVREAPSYEGKPVLLVAHVDDIVVRYGGEHASIRYSSTEATVSGVDASVAAIVGLGGAGAGTTDLVSAGSEVVFRGVPTAVGRIRFPNEAVISSVHFMALDAATEISYEVSDPSIRAEVRRIRRAVARQR